MIDTVAIGIEFEHDKCKQNKAKRGKQWGKHFQHYGAFFNIELHHGTAKSLINKAFQSKKIKRGEVKVVPAGSQKANENP
jgi:hypothetical protein